MYETVFSCHYDRGSHGTGCVRLYLFSSHYDRGSHGYMRLFILFSL